MHPSWHPSNPYPSGQSGPAPPPGGSSYPSNTSGGPGGAAPPRGGASSTTPAYFTDKKKGEVNELKNLLREVTGERDIKRKREVIKKVIAYMTLGIDVSRLFSEMVLCVDTKDLISKKMVYLYLTNYANKNSELAIMCINTLLNDCRNEDPMVRGLALRSLCSLRLDSILEYIHDPLQHSLTDTSAYVRKTGVIGILKVHALNPDLIKESDMIDTLYNMIRDRDPQVVSNCLVALNEIMADEGGIAINQQIILHLLNRISTFNEWGQCNILHIVSRYQPSSDDEVFTIMNTLEQCLRVSNSAVVLGTAKCFFHLTKRMPHIQEQVYERMRQPLLTLMAGGSHEINYCVLHHIMLLVGKKASVFARDYRQFYIRHNEPTHVKYIKVDILSAVADPGNMADIVAELSEYVRDVDQELARRSIRGISDIAISDNFSVSDQEQGGYNPNGPDYYGVQTPAQAMAAMQDHIIDTMVEFLEMNLDYVRDESLVVLKDVLRKYPDKRDDALAVLPRLVGAVNQPYAKAALIWLTGEFGEDMRRAPYMLEHLIDEFDEEDAPQVRLELLTATLKLFFKKPPEVQGMLGRLLQQAINENDDQDVKDRALLYYRLLEQQPTEQAAAIVAQFRLDEPVSEFAEMVATDLKDKLFHEFDTLSVVYNKPSELFIDSAHQANTAPLEELEQDSNAPEEDYPNGYDDAPSAYDQEPPAQQQPRQAPNTDLLDMDFNGGQQGPPPPNEAFALVPNPSLDAPTFQGKWASLPVVAQIQIALPQVPSAQELEAALARNGVMTMASGDVGPQLKFFFYAQDTTGGFFLSETLLGKADGSFSATIKGENEMAGQQYAEHLKRLLFQ